LSEYSPSFTGSALRKAESVILARRYNAIDDWAGTRKIFSTGVSWGDISTILGVRSHNIGALYPSSCPCCFLQNVEHAIALLNNSVIAESLSLLALSLHFGVNQVRKIPYISSFEQRVSAISANCIRLLTSGWGSFETSWDFQSNPLTPDRGD
jgi:hypothetical protein